MERLRWRSWPQDRHKARKAPTVSALAKRYLEEHAIPKKKPRSVEEDRKLLKRVVLPTLGRRKAAGILPEVQLRRAD